MSLNYDWKAFWDNSRKEHADAQNICNAAWKNAETNNMSLSEYKKLQRRVIEIKDSFQRKGTEIRKEQQKKEICDLKKGSILLFNSLSTYVGKKCKLLRKGNKRAKVQIVDTGEYVLTPYTFLMTDTEHNAKNIKLSIEAANIFNSIRKKVRT